MLTSSKAFNLFPIQIWEVDRPKASRISINTSHHPRLKQSDGHGSETDRNSTGVFYYKQRNITNFDNYSTHSHLVRLYSLIT